ncbi:Uma2 family endonuclease [Actinomadura sp. 9N215]|uniref:Uma2 family endonuclease n=1 Tax=Actinomadura sp. 9N215 TaxID=3375150 RepID=UPI0037B43D9E
MPLPVWAADPYSLLITEEQYEALPEEVCKTIEVVDGSVVFCGSPGHEHQIVSHNLTNALRDARPPSPCISVVQDLDMRYRCSNPQAKEKGRYFTVRRPDVSVLHCVERGSKVTSADVFTTVEIAGADSKQRDFQDKKAEYAAQRIPMYLIIVLDADDAIHSVEEYRLDWSGRNYQLAFVHRDVLDTELPEGMKINVTFSDLESV